MVTLMIKIDMPMPKCCKECELAVCFKRYSNEPGELYCGYTKDDISLLWAKRPDFCPLVADDVEITS